TKRLTSAPAEAGNRQFAVRRGKFLHVIGSRIQVCGNGVRIKSGDCLPRILDAGKCAAASAGWTEAGEHIGSNSNVTSDDELVADSADQASQAEDYMTHGRRRRFALHFRINHERLQASIIVLECHPFAVTWRLLQ